MVSLSPVAERRRRKRAVEYALRLGEDEREKINARASASGMSMAHFIRRAALKEAERVASMSASDAEALIRELARIGIDLNRLARSTSTGQDSDTIDLHAVIDELHVALKTVIGLRLS